MKEFKFLNSDYVETTFNWTPITMNVYDIYVPNENHPAFYDTDDFTFVGVSFIQTSNEIDSPYKYMIYKFNLDGTIIKGDIIHPNHPMWNCDKITNNI